METKPQESKMITTSTKVIEPAEASAILDAHVNYRNLSIRRVSAYADAMSKGRWGLSVLIFDTSGLLADGQSRLSAVVKSGIPQEFVCLYGWPEDQVVNIDGGQGRTKAQVAKAERGVKNANKVMSIVCDIEERPDKNMATLNCMSIDLYDKYGRHAEKVIGMTQGCSVLRGAVHGLAFAKAMISMPSREQDITDALKKVCDLQFEEPKMSGLKQYYRWATVQQQQVGNGGGGEFRRVAYLRCARALLCYLNDENIKSLFPCKADPFVVG
jgi:hypothetical protein